MSDFNLFAFCLPKILRLSCLDWWARRAGFQVCAHEEDEFLAQNVELLLGSIGFEQSPADSGHCTLQHQSDELRVFRERFASSCQHFNNRLIGPHSHLLHYLRSVHIGAYGIESDTGFHNPHLGSKEGGDESRRQMLESVSLLLPADLLNCLRNLVEVTFQGSL